MDNKRVIINFIWRFLERSGAQGVNFIVALILARLLEPEVYGIVALITVFTSILNVFVDSGFGSALIQKKDADDLDFSSVFYFNIVSCSVLYLGLFFVAPYISTFYNIPELAILIRVQSLTLIISGVKFVQQAYVSRNMIFKKFFFATLGGTLGAAAIGLWMAWNGYGIWALVVQSLFNNAVDTVILWITVKWRPRKMFSARRLKALLSYGWKLLASSLLDTAYANLQKLIIGKIYTTEDLAFYTKGDVFPSTIIGNINASIDSVLLPALSAEQDQRDIVRGMTRRAIKTSSYIIWPMMIGLAVCAEPLVLLILTEKWLPCVPFLRIFCVTYAFWPIHTANLNAIKALGRSDIFLKLEIIKKVSGLIILLAAMHHGMMVMAYSSLLTSAISQVVNTWPNRKLLKYSYFQQITDIFPSVMLAMFMGACVLAVRLTGLPDGTTLAIQVLTGVTIYIAGSALLKLDSFIYLWNKLVLPFYERMKRG